MMRMPHICRTYTASTGAATAYAERGEESGMDRTRAHIVLSGADAWARAIGAGSPTGTDPCRPRPGDAREQRERRVSQREEQPVIGSTLLRRTHRERANACERTRGTGRGTMATRTCVHGQPMTPTRKSANLPEKEKDRCANTGLLRRVSWVVTVGIRSDRRQTA